MLGKPRTEPVCSVPATVVLAIVPCDCGRPDYPDIYQAMSSVGTEARNIGTLIVVILKAVRRRNVRVNLPFLDCPVRLSVICPIRDSLESKIRIVP